ncbi:Succinate-semialdehyde dehydrogenase [NADP(+)] GabD [Meiothermus luteus]|jgi:succinate-semialdehyde dehydrogenase/glutarate-semialdehyde dehydrogenase|uniref:Succinate-semialdehyde dehydrogenase [NADP(+)] GabD n=1 Tax=Meiothermus luteus TaxID=2026184 RepID=A0A399EMQ0_9DEIN|nr:NAD-dependent succinate-semialdehyde dehydrogenase [Meiothermus luteus]RIH83742.1 Succinate-semialdehyde dehydrogenase [NADP(+)] GabD [Meiothermus luteus]RMH55433.1 MAG: aldehyde dehydrogenase family protein [Deinococcota bacterium]
MTTDLSFPTRAYLNGRWHPTPRTFPVLSPYSGEVLAEVSDCGEEEARLAADAAVAAFREWKKLTGFERGRILRRWNDLLVAHQEELGRLTALEMGKPITEAKGEVLYAASFVEWCAEEAPRVNGELIHSRFPHKRPMALYEPVGPVYAVTPWNFPTSMITRKAAPALAVGCSVIVKPAEQTPLCALYLAKLWEEAGGPPGTLQVLPASDPVPVSKVLMEDMRIRKITFTGSTPVGKILYRQAADTLKRISLELGGNAPFIVFEDADLEKAVEFTLLSKYRNTGQTCVTTNRIYVHRRLEADYAQALAEAVAGLRVGDPLEPSTQIGPLVDKQGLDKVVAHVEDALAKGAKVATGGRSLGGLLYAPTVLTGIRPGMRILEEETFGPVAPIMPFEDEEQVIAWANDTDYGLAAYIWTKDLSRAFRVAEALEYGIVGVNDPVPSAMGANLPFGGYKNSGLGREGGRWGLEEFLETKLVSFALP